MLTAVDATEAICENIAVWNMLLLQLCTINIGITLSGCASIPDTTLLYHPARNATTVTVTHVPACSADGCPASTRKAAGGRGDRQDRHRDRDGRCAGGGRAGGQPGRGRADPGACKASE